MGRPPSAQRPIRVGQATRFERESSDPALQASRVFEAQSRTWCVLTNAGDCGWSAYCSPTVQRVLTVAEQTIAASVGPVFDVAARAFDSVNADLLAQAAAITGVDLELVGGPHASLLVASIEDSKLFVAWIGSGEARVERDGRLAHRTLADSMLNDLIAREQLREEDVDRVDVPNICIRDLTGTPAEFSRSGPITLAPGDVVALFDGVRIRLDVGPTNATIFSGHASPEDRALALVRVAKGERAAAVVLHLDA